MIKVPVSNTTRAKALVIAASLATVLVARFLPGELALLSSVLQVLGIGGVGVGAVQVVQAPRIGRP